MREIKNTGIKVTSSVHAEMIAAMQPTIEMYLSRGMNITTPGDPQKALDILKEFALSKGLPELLPTYHYCLGGENNLDIVCFQDGWPI